MPYNKEMQEWINSRPQVVQDLIEKYPPGSLFNGFYVVSYYEDGCLGVSSIDPRENFEQAVANRQIICANCL